MVKRTSSHAKTNDLAFPIRVKIEVPSFGLGPEANRAQVWLNKEIGKPYFATGAAQAYGGSATAFHFRRLADAQRFLEAFPMLALSDNVERLNGAGGP